MEYTEIRHLGKKSKLSWLLINESRDLQLYNDSFLILIGRAKAGLRNFKFVFTKPQNGVIAL